MVRAASASPRERQYHNSCYYSLENSVTDPISIKRIEMHDTLVHRGTLEIDEMDHFQVRGAALY